MIFNHEKRGCRFMSKNFIELTAEQKLLAVQKYLSGQGSIYSIGAEYGVSDTSIRRWVEKYKRDGEMAFQKKRPLLVFL